MKRKPTGYRVYDDEIVTITVTPDPELGDEYAGVRDDDPALAVYLWPVTKAVGQQHSVQMFFAFIGDDIPDDARYTIEFDGDAPDSEGPFRSYVRKTSPIYDPIYAFRVTAKPT